MKHIQNHHLLIFIAGIFISIIIRSIIILNSKYVADIDLLFRMGDEFISGKNPYISLDYNVYPPLAIYIEVITIKLSSTLGVPFHILTRIWPNIADIMATLVIFKYLQRFKVKEIVATFWSLFFVLNPVLILISASHGQLDSVTNLLVLFSIYFLSFNPSTLFKYLAALFLGLAIVVKPNPLVLLPFMLFFVGSKVKQIFLFVILSITPIILLLIPFLLPNYSQVISKVITYSGVYDFSLAAILRSWVYQDNANYWLNNSSELIHFSKISFVSGAFFLLVLFWQTKKIIKALLSVYLLFLTIYFGISAQYLIWILPFAIVERTKFVFVYTFIALIALVGFYLFFGPEILLGNLWHVNEHQSKFMTVYFFGNLGLFLVVLSWLIYNIVDEWKMRMHNFSKSHRSLLFFSLSLFVLLTFPTFLQVLQTVSF